MEETQPLLSNSNYRRWRLLLNVTNLATGISRPDGPLNSDINSPHVRTPCNTPAAIAKENFLYGISSPRTGAEDDLYTQFQFLPRSRSDLIVGTSALVDESSEEQEQITSLVRNASLVATGINGTDARAHRSESIVVNVDNDEKTPVLRKRRRVPKSSSAPAMVSMSFSGIPGAAAMARPQVSSASSIVRHAVIGVVVYMSS